MRIKTWSFKRSLRRAGGLYLGASVDFPIRIYDEETGERYTSILFTIGFIAWRWAFSIDYNPQPKASRE